MIPYNPSSFNSNKTILEQILELKRWLKDHPSYEIFYSSENGQSVAYTGYLLSSISDPTNLAAGDIVVFDNVTFGVVTSVDTDNGEFGCDPCLSFAGPQGPQGPQGVSITNVSVNGDNHLIVTLSDGTSIDAGTIQYDTYIDLGSSSSGTLTDEQYAKALLNDTKILKTIGTGKYIYTKFSEDSSTILYRVLIPYDSFAYTQYESVTITKSTKAYSVTSSMLPIGINNINSGTYGSGRTIISDGNGGASWSSIPAPEGTAVKSTGATSGQVLTADGSNGASWQTPSGGGIEVVQFNDVSSSGTFSASDVTKLSDDNCVLYGTTYHNVYHKIYEDSSLLIYSYTDVISNAYSGITKTVRIVISSGAWTSWSCSFRQKIASSNVDSQTATNGQVLTADGNGGASWQTPSGGGSTSYMTQCSCSYTDGTKKAEFYFTFIQPFDNLSTTWSTIGTQLTNAGFSNVSQKFLQANGIYYDGSNTYNIIGIRYASGYNMRVNTVDSTGVISNVDFTNIVNATFNIKTTGILIPTP